VTQEYEWAHPKSFGPVPPTENTKELVRDGFITKELYLPPEDRCRCGHVSGAHDAGRVCLARKCPCLKFDQDPRFLLPWPSKGSKTAAP